MAKPTRARLYIIAESPDGPCKVGYADNLYRRFHGIQVGNPRELKLASVWQSKRGSIRLYEKQIHSFLFERAIRGEWFDAPVSLIEDLCKQIGLTKATTGFDFSCKPTPFDDRLSWLIQ